MHTREMARCIEDPFVHNKLSDSARSRSTYMHTCTRPSDEH